MVIHAAGEFRSDAGNSVAGIKLSGHNFAAVHGAITINREPIEGYTD
jgi:hypothetical protein